MGNLPIQSDARDSLDSWLRIHRTPGLGPATLKSLLHRFTSIADLLSADLSKLRAAGLNETLARAVINHRDLNIERELEWAQAPNHHILPISSPNYPCTLRELPDPPILIYAAGDIDLLKYPQLAIVGSRHPTRGGYEMARSFSHYLATQGLGITSGLAMGIDAAAHEGALEAHGITIAVAATGLDRVYPAKHRDLARRIVAEGLMISETPLGSPVSRGAFPRRNRLISGLSRGVLVVEATLKSGSLITARLAAEQGRDVFAIPGSIHNPLARGCHQLIREGAKLVESTADIFSECLPQASEINVSMLEDDFLPGTESSIDPERSLLLDAMGYDPVAIDQAVERTGLTAENISSMLLILELNGWVENLGGGRYIRIHSSLTGAESAPASEMP